MEEFTLPVSPQQTTGTDTALKSSGTAMEPPKPPDACQMQADALRGAMAECKRAMKLVQERQEAWFRCRHGVDLYEAIGVSQTAYDQAILMQSAAGMMTLGLERLSERIGIRIEAE